MWYIAHCGEFTGDSTGCMVDVEHFADPLAYGRRIREVSRMHDSGDLDSWTAGKVEAEQRAGKGLKLDKAELATVLAALRYWQRVGLKQIEPEDDIATDGGKFHPLDADAIDALCERLNCS